VSYNIPGKSGFGQILEGWSVNSAVNVWSGVGVDLNDFIIDFSGTGNIIPFQGNYWNLYGNASDFSAIFGRTTPVPYYSGANLPQGETGLLTFQHALFGHEGLQLAGLEHLADDVGAAAGQPAGEGLPAVAMTSSPLTPRAPPGSSRAWPGPAIASRTTPPGRPIRATSTQARSKSSGSWC